MKNNNKLLIILNILTVVFGIIATIILFSSKVGFDAPIIWVMLFLVFSSITALITQLKNK